MDLWEIQETIVFLENEAKAIEMVNAADFDLSELDDEGRNIADWADGKNFTGLLVILSAMGIKHTRQADCKKDHYYSHGAHNINL